MHVLFSINFFLEKSVHYTQVNKVVNISGSLAYENVFLQSLSCDYNYLNFIFNITIV